MTEASETRASRTSAAPERLYGALIDTSRALGTKSVAVGARRLTVLEVKNASRRVVEMQPLER